MTAFVVALILCSAASASTIKSSPLETSKVNVGTLPSQQSNSDISGTRVVWEERTPYIPFTNTNCSIWLKNLATGYKGKVMASSQNQFDSKISGSHVVWRQVDSSGHSSIYYKNVITGNVGKVLVSTKNQYDPDISGGLIVWTEIEGGVSNIQYKNIFTGEHGSVSPSANNQISPAISGTRVVWMQKKQLTGPPKYLNYKWVIYVKNIKTGNIELVQSSTHIHNGNQQYQVLE